MPPISLYTIGHSNHTPAAFIAHLKQHNVTVLVDVRSVPFSRRFPHFSKNALRALLHAHDIRYSYAGEKLGGRPQDAAVITAGGVDYDAVMKQDWYRDGIARLLELSAEATQQHGQLAIVCSEGDPRHCHRHHLIARSLITPDNQLRATQQAVSIRHILRDGTLEAALDTATEFANPSQASLF